MAHVKLEKRWDQCAWSNYRECEPYGKYCAYTEDNGERCPYCQSCVNFTEDNYRKFEAWQDSLTGCWYFEARGQTYLCTYLEIDGRVYCDKRDVWNKKEEA